MGVDPLWAHVSGRPNHRVTRILGLSEDPAYEKVGDLDLVQVVDQEIRLLDVAMDDLLTLEVGDAVEDQPREWVRGRERERNMDKERGQGQGEREMKGMKGNGDG